MKWLIAIIVIIILLPLATAATLEEAQDAYLNATLEVEQLKSLGFSTQALDDQLAIMQEKLEGIPADQIETRIAIFNASGEQEKKLEAERLIKELKKAEQEGRNPGVNYTFVIEKATWIHDRKELAFESSDALAELHQRMATTNQYVNLSAAQEAVISAEKAFKEERYEDVPIFTQRAYDLLEDAEVAAARERAFLRLARRNLLSYAQDHWFSATIMLIILGALGAWTFIEVRVIRAKQKIKQIKLEMTSTTQSEKKTQEDYYGGKMGSGTYKNRMVLFKNNYLKLKTDLEVWTKLEKEYKKFSLLSLLKLL